MRITVACFGNISCKKEKSALSFYNYSLITHLHEQDLLDKAYCLDYDETVNIPAEKLVKFSGTFFSRLTHLIRVQGLKFFPRIHERLVQELAFGWFVNSKESLSSSDLLLNIKGINLSLYRKAEKKGIPVIIIADVCHPQFIYSCIQKVEKQYKVKDNSPYTNEIRIKYLCRSFEEADFIIPKVGAKVIVDSYIQSGVKPAKLVSMQNVGGVDFNIFKSKEYGDFNKQNKIVFLIVNQQGLKKGLLLLLDAWSRLGEPYQKKAILRILGGIDTDTLQEGKQFMKDQEGFELPGYSSAIYEEYGKADVIVVPSVEDLIPRTLMEGMASGLAAVASNHCGGAEWIEPGVTGYTYDPFDVDHLTAIIKKIIDNKDQIPVMGANARRKMATFSHKTYDKEMIAHLKLLARPGE